MRISPLQYFSVEWKREGEMGDKFGDNEDDELECVEFDEINPLKGRSDSWLHFATQV